MIAQVNKDFLCLVLKYYNFDARNFRAFRFLVYLVSAYPEDFKACHNIGKSKVMYPALIVIQFGY